MALALKFTIGTCGPSLCEDSNTQMDDGVQIEPDWDLAELSTKNYDADCCVTNSRRGGYSLELRAVAVSTAIGGHGVQQPEA